MKSFNMQNQVQKRIKIINEITNMLTNMTQGYQAKNFPGKSIYVLTSINTYD